MIKQFLYLSICFLICTVQAQDWVIEKKLTLDHSVTACDKNNIDEIYLGFDNGSILQLDKKGNELFHTSELNQSEVSVIDASNRLKPMTFHREQQIINYFNRFTNQTQSVDISDLTDQFVWLAAVGTNNDLWFLASDFLELVNYNPVTGFISHFPLNVDSQLEIENPIRMKAFKNMILLQDETLGILIFDQFGNYSNTIKGSFSTGFDVLNGQVVVHQLDSLYSISPFDISIKQTKKAPEGAFDRLLVFENKVLYVYKNVITFYIPR